MNRLVSNEGSRVDLQSWKRRAIFEFFKGFSEPYHGVCIRVDCTETFRFAKQERLSIFLALLHRSVLAAHYIDNFKTRIVESEVWRYERINGGSAVGRPNGTIGFGYYQFRRYLREFVLEAALGVERVKRRDDLERSPGPDLIRYSVLPWFDFTSISHARDLSKEDSAPWISFGKITDANGRCTMPVSIHVHHALADGLCGGDQ